MIPKGLLKISRRDVVGNFPMEISQSYQQPAAHQPAPDGVYTNPCYLLPKSLLPQVGLVTRVILYVEVQMTSRALNGYFEWYHLANYTLIDITLTQRTWEENVQFYTNNSSYNASIYIQFFTFVLTQEGHSEDVQSVIA